MIETSAAGAANPAQPTVPASTPAPAQPTNAQTPPAGPTSGQPGDQAQAPAGSPSDPGAAAADPNGQQGEDERKSERRNSAQERISQLVAQRNGFRARAEAAEAALDRLQRQQRQHRNLEQLSYDEREQLNIQSALRTQRAEELRDEAQTMTAQAAQARSMTFAAKCEAAADRFPNLFAAFDNIPVSQFAADFIVDSDKSVELAHYLTANPNDAARIAALPDAWQGAELARIEARLQTAPQVRKVSAAPPPPPTVGGTVSPAAVDPNAMSYEDYRKWANAQDAARGHR